MAKDKKTTRKKGAAAGGGGEKLTTARRKTAEQHLSDEKIAKRSLATTSAAAAKAASTKSRQVGAEQVGVGYGDDDEEMDDPLLSDMPYDGKASKFFSTYATTEPSKVLKKTRKAAADRRDESRFAARNVGRLRDSSSTFAADDEEDDYVDYADEEGDQPMPPHLSKQKKQFFNAWKTHPLHMPKPGKKK